jgi:His/Glu/Gln/Arg/opine family amino acid ABC transporter permease subunit
VHIVIDDIGFLLGGLLVTLELTALAFIGALLLGTVLAAFRVSPVPPLRVGGAAYVEVLRNMPLLNLLVLVVFGLPDGGRDVFPVQLRCDLPGDLRRRIRLRGPRGGINVIPVGQAEAVVLFLVRGAMYFGHRAARRDGGRCSGAAADSADPMTASRVLFDAPGPRARARIRVCTVLGLGLLAGLLALALWQFGRNGQLDRSRWAPFLQLSYIQFLANGFIGTIATALVAVVSFPLGMVLALGRLSRTRPLRWVAAAYIELFRGVPLLLLIYAFLLALPRFGINLSILWTLVMSIVLVKAREIL